MTTSKSITSETIDDIQIPEDIVNVRLLGEYKIELTYRDGEVRQADLAKWVAGDSRAEEWKVVWDQVKVENGTLIWPVSWTTTLKSGKEVVHHLQLNPYDLYQISTQVKPPIPVRFGLRFKTLRQALKLSQREVAQRVHMAQSSISDIENGKINIGLETVNVLITIGLGVDYLTFFNGSN